MKKTCSVVACLMILLMGGLSVLTASAEVEANTVDLAFEQYIQGFAFEKALSDVEAEVAQTLYGFSLKIEALKQSTSDVLSAAQPISDLKAIRELEEQSELLEDELDRYEDMLEASYRAGDYDAGIYHVFEAELERMEDVLDDLEDQLEVYWDD